MCVHRALWRFNYFAYTVNANTSLPSRPYAVASCQHPPGSSIFNLIQAILALPLHMPILFIEFGRKVAFTAMQNKIMIRYHLRLNNVTHCYSKQTVSLKNLRGCSDLQIILFNQNRL